MPEKDPSTYGLITYLWVTGLAAWGGLVNFYRKVKSGETRAFNVVELIGEIATSAFAGLITFWLCEAAQFNPLAAVPMTVCTRPDSASTPMCAFMPKCH